MTRLLLVDDESHFRNTLAKALGKHGFHIISLAEPDLIPSTIAVQRPAVVLLDLVFESGADGLEICRQTRSWSNIPIIVLSAHNNERIKIEAFAAGADDYVVKPFGLPELLARIRVVQRRLAADSSDIRSPFIRIDDLIINLHTESVTVGGIEVDLTPKEYKLLETLAVANGRVVTHRALLKDIWEKDVADSTELIRSLMKRLRRKLGEDLANPRYILTESSMGYRLNIGL